MTSALKDNTISALPSTNRVKAVKAVEAVKPVAPVEAVEAVEPVKPEEAVAVAPVKPEEEVKVRRNTQLNQKSKGGRILHSRKRNPSI